MERYLKEADRYKKMLVLSIEENSIGEGLRNRDPQIGQWEDLWKELGGSSTTHQGKHLYQGNN